MDAMQTVGDEIFHLGLLILVVDDDENIRNLLCEVLELEGFAPHSFESADLALDFLRKKSGSVGLLLTDVNMPGNIDGADLAKISSREWPLIPIVVMSGLENLQSLAISQTAWFIRKPFSIDAMLACIRNALGRRPSRRR
jgi:DNA-binding NtrC family response regulator